MLSVDIDVTYRKTFLSLLLFILFHIYNEEIKVFLHFTFFLVISKSFGMHASFGKRVLRSEQENMLCEYVDKNYGKKAKDSAVNLRYYDTHSALKPNILFNIVNTLNSNKEYHKEVVLRL